VSIPVVFSANFLTLIATKPISALLFLNKVPVRLSNYLNNCTTGKFTTNAVLADFAIVALLCQLLQLVLLLLFLISCLSVSLLQSASVPK
jgi:hypothetical protein